MKRIFVKQNYGGALTGDQRILPGEYATSDPRLFGTADYLVANGFAIVTSELASLSVDADPEPQPELAVDLTNDELRAQLDELGIEYKPRATKAELLALLGHDTE